MAYELSFAPEFFLACGEPYDRDGLALNSEKMPYSVYSAIQCMSDEQWAKLATELGCHEPSYLSPETVLELVQQTNTCSNLDSPVEVWITPDGKFTIDVYEDT